MVTVGGLQDNFLILTNNYSRLSRGVRLENRRCSHQHISVT
jgi:hypothetical protein